jgi:hypothetical protein
LLAIRGTLTSGSHGASLSRRGAVSGGALTVLRPAARDLLTRMINHRALARHQLVITFDADLIALGCRPIATVRTGITTSGRASTPPGGLAAFASVAFACVAHEVMLATIATRREIAIA